MPTPLNILVHPIRLELGEIISSEYDDAAIEATIRVMIQLGKIAGFGLTADKNQIAPDLKVDSENFKQLVWKASHNLVLLCSSLSNAERRKKLFDLGNKIHYGE